MDNIEETLQGCNNVFCLDEMRCESIYESRSPWNQLKEKWKVSIRRNMIYKNRDSVEEASCTVEINETKVLTKCKVWTLSEDIFSYLEVTEG